MSQRVVSSCADDQVCGISGQPFDLPEDPRSDSAINSEPRDFPLFGDERGQLFSNVEPGANICFIIDYGIAEQSDVRHASLGMILIKDHGSKSKNNRPARGRDSHPIFATPYSRSA